VSHHGSQNATVHLPRKGSRAPDGGGAAPQPATPLNARLSRALVVSGAGRPQVVDRQSVLFRKLDAEAPLFVSLPRRPPRVRRRTERRAEGRVARARALPESPPIRRSGARFEADQTGPEFHAQC